MSVPYYLNWSISYYEFHFVVLKTTYCYIMIIGYSDQVVCVSSCL